MTPAIIVFHEQQQSHSGNISLQALIPSVLDDADHFEKLKPHHAMT